MSAVVPPGVEVVLASGSPRRLMLLEQLGLDPEVVPADIDETPLPGEDPVAYVRRLAREKADALDVSPTALVIAADTTIDLDGEILAKPDDADDAKTMLRRQSGRTHRVHTGIAVRHGDVTLVDVVTTLVTMVPITDELLDWYVATGEPLDKAGGYALQGAGGVLVEKVNGSVSNVVGLPLAPVVALIRRALGA
jgi:septum formation protein